MHNQSKNVVTANQNVLLEQEISFTYEVNVDPYVKKEVLKQHKQDNNSLLLMKLKVLEEENQHLKRMDSLQKQAIEIHNRLIDRLSYYSTIPDLSYEPQGKVFSLNILK
ncbi:hypothetical protein ACNQF7_10080 [Flavobacterium sp. RSP29]|uniref:hypothetical protein n=1 Tax=Flavobacterium sp. RSP29 TaxID=3401731 RepID=UPI003AAE9A57